MLLLFNKVKMYCHLLFGVFLKGMEAVPRVGAFVTTGKSLGQIDHVIFITTRGL